MSLPALVAECCRYVLPFSGWWRQIIAVEAAGLEILEKVHYLRIRKVGVIHGRRPYDAIYRWSDYRTYSISAGLDYQALVPMHANLYATGRAQFISITWTSMQWELKLSKMEGLFRRLKALMPLLFWTKWNSNQRILLWLICLDVATKI
jgi:tryptophan synthase beta subunit